jgi:hypothetical protein
VSALKVCRYQCGRLTRGRLWPCMAALARMGHRPGDLFMELIVDACMAIGLQDFKPQELSSIINSE